MVVVMNVIPQDGDRCAINSAQVVVAITPGCVTDGVDTADSVRMVYTVMVVIIRVPRDVMHSMDVLEQMARAHSVTRDSGGSTVLMLVHQTVIHQYHVIR